MPPQQDGNVVLPESIANLLIGQLMQQTQSVNNINNNINFYGTVQVNTQ